MTWHLASALAFAQPPTQAGVAPNPVAQALNMVATFAVIGVFLYLLMIRPQQKKAKEQASLLQTLRPGDKVLTSSGIVGTVVGVKEKSVSIRSADSKLEILKTAVAEITEKSSSPEKPANSAASP